MWGRLLGQRASPLQYSYYYDSAVAGLTSESEGTGYGVVVPKVKSPTKADGVGTTVAYV